MSVSRDLNHTLLSMLNNAKNYQALRNRDQRLSLVKYPLEIQANTHGNLRVVTELKASIQFFWFSTNI